ncbi:MAG: CoA transferase [Archaeoglobaceae archaeon]|nr:CoA transferase [Archaeoglobaceae archaeon]MDW8128277.1 CoA transferase [Archaeoglobaceae archaeon]
MEWAFEQLTSEMSRKEITQVLTSARVPCSPVYEVSEARNDEQLKARKCSLIWDIRG